LDANIQERTASAKRGGLGSKSFCDGSKGLCDVPYKEIQKAPKIPPKGQSALVSNTVGSRIIKCTVNLAVFGNTALLTDAA
jgi:hypothetical protein